jgi:hypothetical protein
MFSWNTKWKVHLGTRRPETKECERVEAGVMGTTVSAGVRSTFIGNIYQQFSRKLSDLCFVCWNLMAGNEHEMLRVSSL